MLDVVFLFVFEPEFAIYSHFSVEKLQFWSKSRVFVSEFNVTRVSAWKRLSQRYQSRFFSPKLRFSWRKYTLHNLSKSISRCRIWVTQGEFVLDNVSLNVFDAEFAVRAFFVTKINNFDTNWVFMEEFSHINSSLF